jgi:hypothetical protein
MAWTDERMDDLAARMDAGFARTDGDIRELRSRMDAGFAHVDRDIKELRGQMHAGFVRVDRDIKELRTELKGDIDGLRTVMTRLTIAMITGMLGLIAALIGAIATGALAG